MSAAAPVTVPPAPGASPAPAAPSSPPPLLEARGLAKSFGANRVLEDINFELFPGDCLAVCGENGAGKSTLIKALTAVHAPSAGEIRWRGRAVNWTSPRHSAAAGLAAAHQEFSTLDALSVAENIYLGDEPRARWGLLDRRRMNADAGALLGALGIALAPTRQLGQLGVAERQMVEIAKALRRGPQALILDEPTAVLSERDSDRLFEMLRRLRARGVGIVYVSHRLDEIFTVCNRIMVLKDGRVTATGAASEFDHDKVTRAMVGRELGEMFPPKAAGRATGEAVIELKNLRPTRAGRGRGPGGGAGRGDGGGRGDGDGDGGRAGVSCSVRGGEIVALAGLVGAGRSAIAEAIFGLRAADGEVVLRGEKFARRSPSAAIAKRLLMLPEDRKGDGLFPAAAVAANFVATTLRRHAAWWLPRRFAERRAAALKSEKGVVVADVGMPMSELSGGNQQKVLLHRLLENRPAALLLDEPTRGVDVGAKADIYKTLRALAEQGAAILMISSELVEVVGMADRVLVLRGGEVAAELVAAQISEEAVIAAATADAPGPARRAH